MLTFVKNVEVNKPGQYALYRCECGKEKVIRASSVRSGHTKSCGCLNKEAKKHGLYNTYLYKLWHQKVKHKSFWPNFNEFYDWAVKLWKPGDIIYDDKSPTYNPETSIFISSRIAKENNRKRTSLKKYGHEFATQSPDVKEKIKKTNIEKYGCETPSKSDIIKQSVIENNRRKYGVDYPQLLLKKTKEYIKEELVRVDQTILNDRQTTIENIMENILQSLSIKYDRDILMITHNKSYSPDFILFDHNVIIETDNLYRHCELNNGIRYNFYKQISYKKMGFRGLFFRENELLNKSDIISSIISNACKINQKRIYARKCKVVTLNAQNRDSFFKDNHLMGKGWHNGGCVGLEYDGVVVSGLEYTISNNIADVARFCNTLNTSVIGGFSKLLSYITKNNNINAITTFVDKRYGVGDYLYDLGFEKIREQPSHVWIKNNRIIGRLRYRKNSGYDFGYCKLYDCGQARFIKKAG